MDIALKQRLVGASVLIALAVVVLPMLLSGQPELQNESARIEVPEKPPELSIRMGDPADDDDAADAQNGSAAKSSREEVKPRIVMIPRTQ